MKLLSCLLLFITYTAFAQDDSLYQSCSDRNTILYPENLNGFFSGLREHSQIHVVQIGDSHIQMSYFPKALNASLNELFEGSANNSFWFPYEFLGGYTPNGYSVTYSGQSAVKKMVNSADEDKFAITGHLLDLIQPENDTSELVIDFRGQPVSRLEILTETGSSWQLISDGAVVERTMPKENLMLYTIVADSAQTSLTVKLLNQGTEPLRIFGFRNSFDSQSIDFQYYGSSGAKFSDYIDHCTHFNQSVSFLRTDLLIISLGTNDSYLQLGKRKYYRKVKAFISGLKKEFPGMDILLTLPPDTYYRNERPRSYELVNEVLMRIAKQKKCAVWDFGAVMGGNQSILKWCSNGLSDEDLLHLNQKGYDLQGLLLGEALFKAYSTQSK